MTKLTGSSGRKLALLALAGFLLFAVSASSADTFAVHLVSQDSSTITLGWSPQPGYGYLFSGDGQLVSRTNDPNRSTVRFSKQYTVFDIDVITKGANGHYPEVVVPPPPKNQCEDGIDNDGDAKIDMNDPGCSSPTDNDETDPVLPPPSAQLFVAANGNDAGACTLATPCRTFQRAYDVAQNGDVVSVAGGVYGPQNLVRNSKYTTTDVPDVTFRTAPGATVTLADLNFGKATTGLCGGSATAPSNITIQGPMSDNASATNPGDCSFHGGGTNDTEIVIGNGGAWITLDDLDWGNIQMFDVSHVTVENSDLGPCQARTDSGADGCGNNKITDGSDNVSFVHNLIHDFRIVQGSGAHFECMFIGPFGIQSNILVSGNRYVNCEFYDIFVQPGGGNNMTIENNWFDTPFSGGGQRGLWAIGWSTRGQGYRDILIRFNSFAPTSVIDVQNDGENVNHTNFRIVGNIIGRTGCHPSVTYGYNLYVGQSSTCGGQGETVGSPSVYVNSGFLGEGGNFYLAAGPNAAVDKVTPTSPDYALGFDIDGQSRPVGPARDAGSDER